MIAWFINKWRTYRIRSDVETVLLRMFDRLEAAERLTDPLPRLMSVVTALSSGGGSLKKVYPDFIGNEPNLALTLVEAYAQMRMPEADALCDTVFELVRNCRRDRDSKILTTLFMIAPSRAEELQAMREKT